MTTAAERSVHERSHVRPGFSLIEVIVAITIGLLVIGGSLWMVSTARNFANKSATKTHLKNIQVMIDMYKSDTGRYPERLEDLRKSGVARKEIPLDGWDHPFVYRQTPEGKNPYELFSYGPEGKGGAKESRIDVWKD